MAIKANGDSVIQVKLQIGTPGARSDVMSVVILLVSLTATTAAVIVTLAYRLTPDRSGAQGLETLGASGLRNLSRF